MFSDCVSDTVLPTLCVFRRLCVFRHTTVSISKRKLLSTVRQRLQFLCVHFKIPGIPLDPILVMKKIKLSGCCECKLKVGECSDLFDPYFRCMVNSGGRQPYCKLSWALRCSRSSFLALDVNVLRECLCVDFAKLQGNFRELQMKSKSRVMRGGHTRTYKCLINFLSIQITI
jgi:hypothetical protein